MNGAGDQHVLLPYSRVGTLQRGYGRVRIKVVDPDETPHLWVHEQRGRPRSTHMQQQARLRDGVTAPLVKDFRYTTVPTLDKSWMLMDLGTEMNVKGVRVGGRGTDWVTPRRGQSRLPKTQPGRNENVCEVGRGRHFPDSRRRSASVRAPDCPRLPRPAGRACGRAVNDEDALDVLCPRRRQAVHHGWQARAFDADRAPSLLTHSMTRNGTLPARTYAGHGWR